MRTRLVTTTLAVAVLLAGAAGCSKKDDGATVRDIGGTAASGSGSASGSGTASGTSSGTAKSSSGTAGSGSGSVGDVRCEPVGDPSSATSTLELDLYDYKIEVEGEGPVKAGKVNIVAKNEGKVAHEVVVVRADDIRSLPTIPQKGFDEEGFGEDKVLGEIEAFPAGQTCNGVFDLSPGTYVLLCNIVDKAEDGSMVDHFASGMATTITVS